MSSSVLISADSHVVEPPDLWLKYIDPKFKDRAPRLVHQEESDLFECQGEPLMRVYIASFGAAGRPQEQVRLQGRFERDIPQGAWDAGARLKAMAQDGVQAEVLYPSVALRMYAIQSQELQIACFRAYNTWLADFCSKAPDHLKGIGLISLKDVERGIEELRRIRELGLVGGMIALSPGEEQQYNDGRYDPFWAAAQEMEIPLSLHASTTESVRSEPTVADGATVVVHVQRSLALMVFGGVFERFPRLKIVSVENDVGWVPYFVYLLDYMFQRRRHLYRWRWDLIQKALPSEYVRRQVYFTFMHDSSWMAARHQIGIGQVMWASDYPHQDSTWPHSQKIVASLFQHVPEDERRQVVETNVARLYGFDSARHPA